MNTTKQYKRNRWNTRLIILSLAMLMMAGVASAGEYFEFNNSYKSIDAVPILPNFFGSVYQVGNEYCYAGENATANIEIYCTSNFLNWKFYTGIMKGAANTWDGSGVLTPSVWYNGSTYVMTYQGRNGTQKQVGMATSSDGKTGWTKETYNPIYSDTNAPFAVNDTEIFGSYPINSTHAVFWYNTLTNLPRRLGNAVVNMSDMRHATPDPSNVIFDSSGTGYEYNHFMAFPFTFNNTHYLLVVQQNTTFDYGKIYLYNSTDYRFRSATRNYTSVPLQFNTTNLFAWDNKDIDTASVLVTNDSSIMMYSGSPDGSGTWYTGLSYIINRRHDNYIHHGLGYIEDWSDWSLNTTKYNNMLRANTTDGLVNNETIASGIAIAATKNLETMRYDLTGNSFIPNQSRITQISFKYSISGAPPDTQVQLYKYSGNFNKTFAYVANSSYRTTINGWNDYPVNWSVDNQTYIVVMAFKSTGGTLDAGNTVQILASTPSTYANGNYNYANNNATTWSMNLAYDADINISYAPYINTTQSNESDAGSGNTFKYVNISMNLSSTNTSATLRYGLGSSSPATISQSVSLVNGMNNITLTGNGRYFNKEIYLNTTNSSISPELISIKEQYQLSSGCTGTITGRSPNETSNTVIDINTTWESVTCTLGGNITVGNASQRVYFNVTNSSITLNGNITMAGSNATNVTIYNSTIFWDIPASDANKNILVNNSNTYSSRLEINNSILKGVSNSTLFGGISVWSYFTNKHTIIVKNTNISYASQAMSFFKTGAPPIDVNWIVASDSTLENITLFGDTYGLKMSNGIGINGSVSSGAWGNQNAQYWGGDYIKNVTMNNASEGLYVPMDGATVQDNIFYSNYTKLNVMLASRVLFQRNEVHEANFNGADGDLAFSYGENNTFRNNTFINSGAGVARNYSRWYDNSFNNPATNSIISTWSSHNRYENTMIQGGTPAIEIKVSAFKYNINNTYINTSINGTTWAITIDSSNQTKLIDLYITNSTNHLRFGTYNTPAINDTFGTDFINTNLNLSKVVYSPSSNNSINISYYTDINVIDSIGAPISGATITFTNIVNSSYPSINRLDTTRLAYTTDTSGHSPLPIGNDSTTIVLVNMSQNNITQQNMSYTVTVSKSGYTTNSSVTLSPVSSWYRFNPNTYQNTITIILTASSIPTNIACIIPSEINTAFDIVGILLFVFAAGMIIYGLKGMNYSFMVVGIASVVMGAVLILVGYLVTVTISNGVGCV